MLKPGPGGAEFASQQEIWQAMTNSVTRHMDAKCRATSENFQPKSIESRGCTLTIRPEKCGNSKDADDKARGFRPSMSKHHRGIENHKQKKDLQSHPPG